MKYLIRGILKYLNISWKSEKPVWWPDDVPYQSVTAAPHGWEGNWSDKLREIIQSYYEHYNLDPETYVQVDPEDTRERERILEELIPQPPPPNSPAAQTPGQG